MNREKKLNLIKKVIAADVDKEGGLIDSALYLLFFHTKGTFGYYSTSHSDWQRAFQELSLSDKKVLLKRIEEFEGEAYYCGRGKHYNEIIELLISFINKESWLNKLKLWSLHGAECLGAIIIYLYLKNDDVRLSVILAVFFGLHKLQVIKKNQGKIISELSKVKEQAERSLRIVTRNDYLKDIDESRNYLKEGGWIDKN